MLGVRPEVILIGTVRRLPWAHHVTGRCHLDTSEFGGDKEMRKRPVGPALEVRMRSVRLLNQRLADCMDLQLYAKHAQWNAHGPNQDTASELFEQVRAAMEGYAQDLAMRVRRLEGFSEGTARLVAQASSLALHSESVGSGVGYAETLSAALTTFASLTKDAGAQAGGWGDHETANVLRGVFRGVQKEFWFVSYHLRAGQSARLKEVEPRPPVGARSVRHLSFWLVTSLLSTRGEAYVDSQA
jgi:starvation-inducible DNA-binding protein